MIFKTYFCFEHLKNFHKVMPYEEANGQKCQAFENEQDCEADAVFCLCIDNNKFSTETGAKGGVVRSDVKTRAAIENGKRGGRPHARTTRQEALWFLKEVGFSYFLPANARHRVPIDDAIYSIEPEENERERLANKNLDVKYSVHVRDGADYGKAFRVQHTDEQGKQKTEYTLLGQGFKMPSCTTEHVYHSIEVAGLRNSQNTCSTCGHVRDDVERMSELFRRR